MGRKRSREKDEWTTVSIKKETKKMIDNVGKYGDNFDDIIKRIFEEAEGKRKKKG